MDKIYSSKKRSYRRALLLVLLLNLCAIAYCLFQEMDGKIPNDICVFTGQEEDFCFRWPVSVEMTQECVDVLHVQNTVGTGAQKNFGMQQSFTVTSGTKGSYQASLKLFGLFHYKNINFHVLEEEKVMPCGDLTGLYVQCDGILVLGTANVQDRSGKKREPAKGSIQAGDYIESINGKKVHSIEEISNYMEHVKGDSVKLGIRRHGEKMERKLPCIPSKDGGKKLGIWIREDTQGIGTMTYVTPQGEFGALGHGITDADTGEMMEITDGNVYHTKILKIIKGQSGNPGEMIGMIDLSTAKTLGTLKKNTPLGIFGTVNPSQSLSYKEDKAVPVGLKQEVKKGKVTILCQVGDTVEEYGAVIDALNVNSNDNKGITLHITDERLLERTGGIIQGMSGSPIMQDGKCIGAVTHVFVKDASIGYGTFLENMLIQ